MKIRPSLKIALAASATALFMAAPARADVKTGVDAWSRGDYARAIAEWKAPADRGDPDAQFNLAQAYKLGRGVKADLAKAEELFGKAAERGHLQASDNYGLLLFQRGEHAKAMPYITAASDRGDPRAQYLLGLAHFNGDQVPKDWVRAYALVSLAQQAGLPQAAPALSQMDKYIPLEQRQQSVSLASTLAQRAAATRDRQLASVDLGAPAVPVRPSPPARGAAQPRTSAIVSAENAVAAARAAEGGSPRTAGADFARPRTPEMATTRPAQRPSPAAMPRAAAAPSPTLATGRPAAAPSSPASRAPAAPAAPASAASGKSGSATPAATTGGAAGSWRVQLGAFRVPGNAEALWNRVKTRPELSGRAKLLVPAGKVSKLQAGGFASQADAQSACSRLSAAGFACITIRN